MKKILLTTLILISLAAPKYANATYNTTVDLATQTTGTLPVAHGGTGATSKTCSSCGKKHDMPLAKRQMTCDGCGLDISRDLNAAINIRNWSWLELTKNTAGTAGINACGVTSDGPDEYSSGSYVAMRQEKLCAIGTEARTL